VGLRRAGVANTLVALALELNAEQGNAIDACRTWCTRWSAAGSPTWPRGPPTRGSTEVARTTPMITASVASPRKAEATAVTASRTSNGKRSWRTSTGSARTRYERTALAPAMLSRRAAPFSARPPVRLPSRASTSSASSTPACPAGATGHRWWVRSGRV
jgi:hypothetical protein